LLLLPRTSKRSRLGIHPLRALIQTTADNNAIHPFDVNVPEVTLHGSLAIILRTVVMGIAVAPYAVSASAQTAKDVKGPTPLVAIQDEPPVKLVVDPIPEQLALGRRFRSEGKGAGGGTKLLRNYWTGRRWSLCNFRGDDKSVSQQ
jgi:hypothetical protein